MATSTHLDDKTKQLLKTSFPDAVNGMEDPAKLSSVVFPSTDYSSADKAEIEQWLITSSHIASSSEDAAKTAERLSSLDTHLSTRTTLLGSKPSVADVAMYTRLAPVVSKWSSEERTGEQGFHHIVRHLDFVQNAPLFGLKLDEKVKIDQDDVLAKIKPIDAKALKEQKKKEKELAAAGADKAAASGGTPTTAASSETKDAQIQADKQPKKEKAKSTGDKIAAAVGAETPGVKKEKKEKAPKQPKSAPAAEKPLSPSLIDLRVGHILKAVNHPNADSLYVSTIACGDAPGTDNTTEHAGQVVRTVCSGLNGLIPLAEMQDRKIVVVCNLKPVTMRGVKSAAMVLAASPRAAAAAGEEDKHGGPVELVSPPADASAGEKVWFEGWEGEPEPVLNPKKKIWEACQPGFTTTEGLEVAFEVAAVEALRESGKSGVGLLKTRSGGVCTVKSLKGATVR
ncbi:G4 quadruplex nucleic acid binding protein [Elasticomyces elasticus]|nr:G4 quadruplex nucleic acid binding protein [Elasticomyces elasticus]